MKKLEAYESNGKVYVSTSFLMALYKTSQRNVGNWLKKETPLPKYKLEGVSSNMFIVDEAMIWHDENIDKTKSRNGKGEAGERGQVDWDNYENLSVSEKRKLLALINKNQLDEKAKTEEIIDKEYKNKQHEKDWVRKEKPSQTIKGLARSFISLLKNLQIKTSKDGENKSQDELFHIMDKEISIEIKKLERALKSDSDIDLHQFYKVAIDKINSGTSVEEIVKKIQEID